MVVANVVKMMDLVVVACVIRMTVLADVVNLVQNDRFSGCGQCGQMEGLVVVANMMKMMDLVPVVRVVNITVSMFVINVLKMTGLVVAFDVVK